MEAEFRGHSKIEAFLRTLHTDDALFRCCFRSNEATAVLLIRKNQPEYYLDVDDPNFTIGESPDSLRRTNWGYAMPKGIITCDD